MKPGDLVWWQPNGCAKRLQVEIIDFDEEPWVVCWVNGVVERVLKINLAPMHPLEALAAAERQAE